MFQGQDDGGLSAAVTTVSLFLSVGLFWYNTKTTRDYSSSGGSSDTSNHNGKQTETGADRGISDDSSNNSTSPTKSTSALPDDEDDDGDDHQADNDQQENASKEVIVSVALHVFRLAWPDRMLVMFGLLLAVVSSLISVLRPVAQGLLLDLVVRTPLHTLSFGSTPQLATLFSFLVLLEVGDAVLSGLRTWIECNVGDYVRQRAQLAIVQKALSFETGYFHKNPVADLTKCYHHLNELHHVSGKMVPDCVSEGLKLTGVLIYLLFYSGAVGQLASLFVGLQLVFEHMTERRLNAAIVALLRVERKANRHRDDTFSNIAAVKNFSREDQRYGSFKQLLMHDKVLRQHCVLMWALLRCVRCAVITCAGLATWYIGIYRVNDNYWAVGTLSSTAALVMALRQSATTLLSAYADLGERAIKLRKAFDIMNRSTQMPSKNGTAIHRKNVQGDIHFRNVKFSYPTRPDQRVLDGLNLTLKAGTVTALCGPSGGGKSTIARLLLRSYDPCEGSVLLDGQDIRSLNLTSFHRCTAVVPQEPRLFATTVAKNIAFACDNVSQDEIEQAARLANAHDFISAFPQGYDTIVGENGVRLSGGQKQRIAIARAIITNPRLLVLDEATSALDTESEHLVQEALDRAMKGRTTLVIAHRLSTVKTADNIAVIENGVVAEQGTHESLIKDDASAYLRLIQHQLRSE